MLIIPPWYCMTLDHNDVHSDETNITLEHPHFKHMKYSLIINVSFAMLVYRSVTWWWMILLAVCENLPANPLNLWSFGDPPRRLSKNCPGIRADKGMDGLVVEVVSIGIVSFSYKWWRNRKSCEDCLEGVNLAVVLESYIVWGWHPFFWFTTQRNEHDARDHANQTPKSLKQKTHTC